LEKTARKPQGGIFLTHTVDVVMVGLLVNILLGYGYTFVNRG